MGCQLYGCFFKIYTYPAPQVGELKCSCQKRENSNVFFLEADPACKGLVESWIPHDSIRTDILALIKI